MKIPVAQLQPNPFRNISSYPLDPEKIAALKASINNTTFWDNLLVRKADDGFQLAYGHHRWQALRELGIEEIDIPVRDFDNTAMARIMAHENMQEWGHSATVEQETVRSIITAYGEGKIDLPQPKRNETRHGASVRYAPSFLPRGKNENEGDHPYTVATLAEFLGWKIYKVEGALNALELIEAGVVEPETFHGLSSRQSEEVANQAKRVLNEKIEADPKAAARTVAQGLAGGMRKAVGKSSQRDSPQPGGAQAGKSRATVTIHSAKHEANVLLGRDIRKAVADKPRGTPDIDRFALEIARDYGRTFYERETKMAEVIKYNQYLSNNSHKLLVGCLQRMLKDGATQLMALDPKALKQVLDEMRTGGVLLQFAKPSAGE